MLSLDYVSGNRMFFIACTEKYGRWPAQDLGRRSNSLSDAGRQLFSISGNRKGIPDDADCLRKYLQRFALTANHLPRA